MTYVVVTGGPGAGKTTLLDHLAALGHTRTVEAGRAIIQAQQAIDGPALPWRDPDLFAELMLSWELRSHARAADLPGPVFFDRGVPDVAGYLRVTGRPVPAHVHAAAKEFRYGPVFIAPPWPEIFARDPERRQDLAEAIRTHDAMVEVYTEYGYHPIELPKTPVADRAAFILDALR